MIPRFKANNIYYYLLYDYVRYENSYSLTTSGKYRIVCVPFPLGTVREFQYSTEGVWHPNVRIMHRVRLPG